MAAEVRAVAEATCRSAVASPAGTCPEGHGDVAVLTTMAAAVAAETMAGTDGAVKGSRHALALSARRRPKKLLCNVLEVGDRLIVHAAKLHLRQLWVLREVGGYDLARAGRFGVVRVGLSTHLKTIREIHSFLGHAPAAAVAVVTTDLALAIDLVSAWA